MKIVSPIFHLLFRMIHIRPVPRPTCGHLDIAFFSDLLVSINDLNLVLIFFSVASHCKMLYHIYPVGTLYITM